MDKGEKHFLEEEKLMKKRLKNIFNIICGQGNENNDINEVFYI